MDAFPVPAELFPQDGVKIEGARRVDVAQFGDGYEQAADNGINVDISTIDIEWKNAPKDFGDTVYGFLFARLKHTPFLFTIPATNQTITVKCETVTRSVYNEYIYTTLSCTLKRVAYLGSLT